MTRPEWIESHPYLADASNLDSLVSSVLSETSTVCTWVPTWNSYAADFRAGIPLLHRIKVDLTPAAVILKSLTNTLAEQVAHEGIRQQVQNIKTELGHDPSGALQAIHALVGTDELPPPCAGILRYLGWSALAQYLHPVVSTFGTWRDEDQWCRSYCPMCGARPAMSQLVGIDSGRQRLLACAFCGTRWQFRRTMCPFCDNEDDRLLRVLTIEGEDRLRIDACDACGGYLKTYIGTGDEDLLLADWTSIHLDILAQDRGLTRMAASLYQI